ncbi:MAG: hypothetical protein ACL7BU_06870 [Candidatus Phlomobacter fragariae]
MKGGYRDEVITIFNEFNAKRLSDVTHDSLALWIEKAESVLADSPSEDNNG